MENNPVKQRVFTLTEQWRQAALSMPDKRMFCWVGASSVDYKMIQGFITYHMSEEGTLDDIFFCFKHPFDQNSPSSYGSKILHDVGEYIKLWNNDKELTEFKGSIDWRPGVKDGKDTDAAYFIKNINLLAEKLEVNGKDQFLAIALLPQAVDDFSRFSGWLSTLLQAGIANRVRFLIYDNYDYNAFDGLLKQFPLLFHKIHTDLNMVGAMHQILEDAKSGKTDPQQRDAVSFQQLIIKITEAIAENDKNKIDVYLKQCQELAKLYDWPHMEATVYYFVHSWYVVNNQQTEAHKTIDKAILKNDEAFNKNILVNEEIRYYYRVAKGNLYFMNKKFEEAAQVYKSCLALNRDKIDKQLLLGVYQMMANSQRHAGDKKNAWASFLEGWAIVKNEPEATVKSNKLMQSYAKDMLEVADSGEKGFRYYNEVFSEYWGPGWEKNLV